MNYRIADLKHNKSYKDVLLLTNHCCVSDTIFVQTKQLLYNFLLIHFKIITYCGHSLLHTDFSNNNFRENELLFIDFKNSIDCVDKFLFTGFKNMFSLWILWCWFKHFIHFANNLIFINFNNSEHGMKNFYLYIKSLCTLPLTLLLVSDTVSALRIPSLL